MVDKSVALMATSLYSSIQDRPRVENASDAAGAAIDFQKSLKVEFNKFASMSPQQILSYIKTAQNGDGHYIRKQNDTAPNGLGGSVIKNLRETLETQERMTRKSLINEASLIDVLTATTEATNTVKTLVEVRNKFMEAYDKVMNMNL